MLIELFFYCSVYEPEKATIQTVEKGNNIKSTMVPQPKCDLSIEEIFEGNGFAAKEGDLVSIYYQSYLADTDQFINVHLSGEPFKLQLGEGKVVIGLDKEIVGMKPGSKRKIICPPEMAFGKVGIPSVIPPDATITYEVELKSINIAD